jgi:UDP-glucose 4-epimerase
VKVLVTGATGAVGPAVVEHLLREGHQLRLFVRGAAGRSDIEIVTGDCADRAAVDRAVAGMDAVVHLAAVLHQSTVTPAVRDAYEAVNVGGTANVIDAARAHGVRRVIVASTIAVYGYNRGMVLQETSSLLPDTDYARSKVRAEEIALAGGATVFRFGAIYGSRVKGNYQRLVRTLTRGKFMRIGKGTNRRTVIFDEDAAAAIALGLTAPAAAGQVYNVAHPHTPTVNDILSAISSALGRRPPRFRLPAGLVRAAVAAVERSARAIGVRSPVTAAMVDKYLEDVVVSSAKIERELGFVARHDIDEGWAMALRAMRDAPPRT